jgi:hypothetical protein
MNLKLLSRMTVPTNISTDNVQCYFFLSPQQHLLFLVTLAVAILKDEIICFCGIDLHFPEK